MPMPTEKFRSDVGPLDYAPATLKRRKVLRRLAWCVAVLAITFAGCHWGPSAWRQAKILYWQRQCMNYSAPAEMVVYEEEPTASAALLAKGSLYSAHSIDRSNQRLNVTAPKITAAEFVPDCWRKLGAALPSSISFAPVGQRTYGTIAFMHERISLGGHRRLVSIHCFQEFDAFTSKFTEGFNCWARGIEPATFIKPPVWPTRAIGLSIPVTWPKTPPNVRIYAGQPDPADASHFTIRYEMWGQSDVLDGWLRDDDSVTLMPRRTPQEPQVK